MFPSLAPRFWVPAWFWLATPTGCSSVGLLDERPEGPAAGEMGSDGTGETEPVGPIQPPGDGPNPVPGSGNAPSPNGDVPAPGDGPDVTDPTSSSNVQPAATDEPMDSVEEVRLTGTQQFTRLTRAEYAATVETALDIRPNVNSIPEDARVGPFTSNAETSIDPVHPYMLAAEELAAEVIPSLLPACDDDAEACLHDEYAAVLAALYRRPVRDDELTAWAATINALAAEGVNSTDASRAVFAAILTGPDFLYRSTPDADVHQQLVEHLAFALWDAPPDDDLSQAASSPGFASELPNIVERALASERAVPVLARFLAQWLDVDTDLRLENADFANSTEYVELLDFVRAALEGETPITDYIAGEQALLLRELFIASTRHPDQSRRPIFRGLLVRRALLCDAIPAPSADLVALAGQVGDRTEDGRCAGCHQLIDPIGNAFGVLDDDVETRDGSAAVVGHAELEGSYESLAELLTAVSQSRAFAECFAEHWLEFLLERSDLEQEWISELADSVQRGASLRELAVESALGMMTRGENETRWCGAP